MATIHVLEANIEYRSDNVPCQPELIEFQVLLPTGGVIMLDVTNSDNPSLFSVTARMLQDPTGHLKIGFDIHTNAAFLVNSYFSISVELVDL